MLDSGQLARYVDRYSVTGLTSNPTTFDKAIETGDYDVQIRAASARGVSGEELFFELAIDDLRRAAALFRPAHERTDGVDGWVSLEVPPRLAYDAEGTVEMVKRLHARAGIPNLFIKIPGTKEGCVAIEECIAAGLPVNVTLLFSVDHYGGAVEAFLRGVERRVRGGLNPRVPSVASFFLSRWDRAVNPRVPAELKNRLALAVGRSVYREYRRLMDSRRWLRLQNEGARMQRVLWASTGVKDASAPATYYVGGLFAPFTVDTIPENTLQAFFEQGVVGDEMPPDGGDSDEVLARFAAAGVDVDAVGVKLQEDGAAAFQASFEKLLQYLDQRAGTSARPSEEQASHP
jgi:transaldolase